MRGILVWQYSKYPPATRAKGLLFTAILSLAGIVIPANAQPLIEPTPNESPAQTAPLPAPPGAAEPQSERLLQAPPGAAATSQTETGGTPEPAEAGPESGAMTEMVNDAGAATGDAAESAGNTEPSPQAPAEAATVDQTAADGTPEPVETRAGSGTVTGITGDAGATPGGAGDTEPVLQAPAGAATAEPTATGSMPEPVDTGTGSGAVTGLDLDVGSATGDMTGDGGGAESVSGFQDSQADDLVSTTSGGGFFSDIAWNGYFKNETAYRVREPRSITKMRNTAGLTGVYSFNPTYRLTASGWLYYDMAYDVFDYDTIAARLERNGDEPLTFLFNLGKEKDASGADLRELYLDMMYDSVDIRLGRQIVVWGVLEGVRIVDEINPQDFREMIMPDLLDYRIPLWTGKLDWYRDEGTWEFLWIPDIRFHKPAPPGSEWELLQRVPGTLEPDTYDPMNWEYGVRLSTTLWDADMTFSYFYTWDDFPVVFRRILLNQLDTEPQFMPTYTRITIYGTTMSKQVGDFILKGEFAYVTGKYFAVDNIDRNNDALLDFLGELQRDHIRWGLGVEFNWNGMDISPGITQWIIPDYDPAMVQDQVDTSINLFLRKEYPRSSMLFELLMIEFTNLHELYINPEWTFFITDRFQIATGFDMFSGKNSQFGVLSNPLGAPQVRDQRSQFVGNFHDNDRVYLEFTYSF